MPKGAATAQRYGSKSLKALRAGMSSSPALLHDFALDAREQLQRDEPVGRKPARFLIGAHGSARPVSYHPVGIARIIAELPQIVLNGDAFVARKRDLAARPWPQHRRATLDAIRQQTYGQRVAQPPPRAA